MLNAEFFYNQITISFNILEQEFVFLQEIRQVIVWFGFLTISINRGLYDSISIRTWQEKSLIIHYEHGCDFRKLPQYLFCDFPLAIGRNRTLLDQESASAYILFVPFLSKLENKWHSIKSENITRDFFLMILEYLQFWIF